MKNNSKIVSLLTKNLILQIIKLVTFENCSQDTFLVKRSEYDK